MYHTVSYGTSWTGTVPVRRHFCQHFLLSPPFRCTVLSWLAFTPLTITAHVRPALIAAFALLRSRCRLSFLVRSSAVRAKRRREASPEETHKRKRIMEDDLYGDLDAGVASAEVARLRADLSRAEASAATADGELSRARAEAAQLRQANEILERNISVLFNTALAELARKDREIARLQGAAGT